MISSNRRIKFLFILIIFLTACKEQKILEINIIETEPIQWWEKTPCKIEYTENDISNIYEANIHYRGGSSSKYYKHSFALETDEKITPSNLPKDDDWIINAGYIDKTFMRHKISYELFRQMNPSNIAARCAYVNLKKNGEYKGLYILMEEVNAGMIKLDKKDSLAMLFKDPPIFRDDRLRIINDTVNYYAQKYPEFSVSNKTVYMEELRSFLFDSDEKEFAENVWKEFDRDNILDWHLMLLFSNNSDGILKNFYLYQKKTGEPFRIAIWDYDHSFGRDGDNAMNMMEIILRPERAILIRRLMESEELAYKKQLSEKWFKYRRSGLISIEQMDQMIDENHEIIKDDLAKNFQKWPVNGEWYTDDNDYKQELQLIRDYTQLRINYLDTYFKEIQKK